jgi:hypothetical protein
VSDQSKSTRAAPNTSAGSAESPLPGTRLRQVGEPVPGKHALDGHRHAVAEGRDRFEKDTCIGRIVAVQQRRAGLIEDAQVHASGVQKGAAVKSVRLFVKAHHGLLAMGGGVCGPPRR